VEDLVKKTKQLELLISMLPDPPDPARFDAEYAQLELEQREAEEAYMEAIKEAGRLFLLACARC
jgi:hypothetical protein